jgi:hypothetical protein
MAGRFDVPIDDVLKVKIEKLLHEYDALSRSI